FLRRRGGRPNRPSWRANPSSDVLLAAAAAQARDAGSTRLKPHKHTGSTHGRASSAWNSEPVRGNCTVRRRPPLIASPATFSVSGALTGSVRDDSLAGL